MDNLSRLDYYEIGRNYIRTHAKRIDPGQVDVQGSDANLFVGSTSYVAFAVHRQMGERFNALWLDGCEGEDLDRWGFDRYRTLRKGSSPGRTSIAFRRATAGAGAGVITAGRKFRTEAGIEYITTQPAAFASTTLSSTVFARAVNAGKSYQVGANTLTKPSAGTLFDPKLSVTNLEAAAGGEDRESDDVFRERIRDFWRAMSRGTLGAIEYGARSVPGVESASASEVTDGGRPARLVMLYVADSSGVSSTALNTSVEYELDEWKGAGVNVLLFGGQPQMIDGIGLRLLFRAGVDTVTVGEQIRAAIVDYVNSLGINQTLYRGNLSSVLSRYQNAGLIPTSDTIVYPIGDLVPNTARTLRIRPENVSLVA
jgi:uncharacterized phage protein gp47/JayE